MISSQKEGLGTGGWPSSHGTHESHGGQRMRKKEEKADGIKSPRPFLKSIQVVTLQLGLARLAGGHPSNI